jgi:hypothetical protein
MIEPPEGYRWQLIDINGTDCSGTPIYAEDDAVEARLWREDGDLLIDLKRKTSVALWYQDGTGTGGVPLEREFSDLDEALRALALVP